LEEAPAPAAADEGKRAVEVTRHVGGDATDRTLVALAAGGGGEADGGAKHGGKAVDLLSDVGAVDFEEDGVGDGFADAVG